MAKRILPLVLALFCVAHAAAQGTRTVPPGFRLRGPATFKTDECVVNLHVDKAGAPRPSGETTILIDDRHRLTVRVLPRLSRGPSFVTFVPHDSLCDGNTHKVQLTWKGGKETYHTIFPRPGPF